MAQNYVTTAQQGYQKHEGNLLDAATSAMALYNLPQSMKLAMQQKQLQNQALQLGNTGQDVSNQTGQTALQATRANLVAPQNLQSDINSQPAQVTRQPFSSSTQGSVTPGQKSAALNPVSARVIADTEGLDNGLTAFNGLGPQSIGNGQGGNMYANTNENSSNGGISNDISPKGTSAYEMSKTPGIDPYSTSGLQGGSILSAAHSKALTGGIPNNAPAMANGTSARGNSMLPDTIPGSTQGGGPASSPFSSPPFSSKGISFNSGETADNSSSLPREDSNGPMPVVASNDDHAKLPVGALYKDPMGNTRRKGQVA